MTIRRRDCLRGASLFGAAALLPLAGCVSVGVGGDLPPHAHLRLSDAGGLPSPLDSPLVPALLIQALPADALADTVSIAYARERNRFQFYQLSSWTERPVRQLPRLLQRRLEARQLASAVALLGEPVRADWLLTLAVDTLHHDLTTTPGRARIALTVELIDRRARERVARQQFSTDVSTASDDAAGAAAAMSQALAQTFDALLPWLEEALQSARARS